MKKPLSKDEQEEMLVELAEAHNVISKLASDLRSRYSLRLPVVKAADKAEQHLFQLKRELRNLDPATTPGKSRLPAVRRGGKIIDLDDL